MPSRLRRRPGYRTRPSAMKLSEQLGLLRSRDLEAHGVPRTELRLMLSLGFLREVAPGIWAGSHAMFDSTTVAAKRVPQAVVCLKSALWFHRLLPQEPSEVWLAIGEHARRPRCEQPRLQVARFSGAALTEGIEHHTVRGVPVRVYSVAKTVADLFKYRNKLGYPLAVHALRDALLRGQCTREEVLHFGGLCRVTKTLTPYLEVLQERWSSRLSPGPPPASASR